MLRILGLSPVEQGLYEALVAHPPVTHAELTRLAADHAWTDHTGPALARLRQLDLVTLTSTDPPRYAVTPPQTALGALVGARSQELTQVHQRMLTLSTQFHQVHGTTADGGPTEPVEVVHGAAEIDRYLTHVLRSARHELCVCDAPPYAAENQLDPNQIELELLRGGMSCRVLYDHGALDLPGRVAAISQTIEAGEQARVTETPLKMILSDRPLGMLQLDTDTAPSDRVLIVRDPVLLAALFALFELCWERAVPLRIRDGKAEVSRPGELPDVDRDLLSLLVSGLTDRGIADHLGWSERTVRRRVSDMMSELDARTRFQAGYRAVARGWLTARGEGHGAQP
ncbi:LuxR C-terminal-related transcriptional regulator [Micromonospora sp. NPDC050200]|uniref:LuxR C-terminal-related transcriptional regulator n=1 Tax=Micromonospora sp. NPDC050200 TaxID=3155664 RepID=UPI0033FAA977